ncbi:MAG: hypothetical protein RBT43_01625 [bacterium]|jgi:hypothetical protein|nr:hypothetical protein [bacterium]
MKYDTTQGTCKAGKIVGWCILGIGLAFLFGFVIKGLWNALMPEIFGLKTIGYWQALGLTILSRILFGGMPKGGTETKKEEKEPASPVETE